MLTEEIRSTTASTFRADIFIAGDRRTATEACREFCLEGLCVTVSETNYVYTGGMESGVHIGLINYPCFPVDNEMIHATAIRLAKFLIERLHQSSCTVVSGIETVWLSRLS